MDKENRSNTYYKTIPFLIVMTLSIFVIALIILLAIERDITYDETFTVLEYVNTISLPSIGAILNLIRKTLYLSLANNHLLNTYSIYFFQLITGIKYNVFIIRLPNIICGSLFVAFSSYLVLNKKINWLTFLLLILNPLIYDYFSIARGYGMALFFNTLSIYYLIKYKDSCYQTSKYLSFSLLFCTLGEYSNSVSILLMASYFIYFVIDLLMNKKFNYKFNCCVLFITIILNICIIIYHFYVTRNGLPMYSTNSLDTFLSFFTNFGLNKELSLVVVLLLLVLFIVNTKNDIICSKVLIIFIAITICSLFVFKKGMPLERELLPYSSLYAFSIGEIIDTISSKIKKDYKNAFILILSIFMIFNFSLFCVNKLNKLSTMHPLKDRAYDVINNPNINKKELYDEIGEYPMYFYREQIKYNCNIDIFK